MSKRITIQQVAKAAGVHYSTVSLSLKNSPKIPLSTRERIRRLADEMGYVPDPMLSALSTYRKSHLESRFQGVLAWLDTHPDAGYWKSNRRQRNYFEGAEAKARLLGYKIQRIWMGAPNASLPGIRRQLLAQNIPGILFAPQASSRLDLPFDISGFSAVSVGYGLNSPRVTMIGTNPFYSVLTCFTQLTQLGYRKIGMILREDHDRIVDFQYSAAYRTCLGSFFKRSARNRLFVYKDPPLSLKDWLRLSKPDAILTMPYVNIMGLLEKEGLSVPDDVGVALLFPSNEGASPDFAGVSGNSRLIGQTAIEYLVGLINQGVRGEEVSHKRLLIDAQWMDGPSLRPQ